MSDELREYMEGWKHAAIDLSPPASTPPHPYADDYAAAHPAYARGYAAGRAAYEQAERQERERLERCPRCRGTRKVLWHDPHPVLADDPDNYEIDCPACHGSGQRTP